MKFRVRFKHFAILAVAVINSILYLNCSGFKADGSQFTNLSSLSCRAKAQASAELKIEVSQCENIENYLCERRVFSPDVENGKSLQDICGIFDGQPVCVKAHSLSFNTEAARSPSSELEFADGGEFNREEFQCIYNLPGAAIPLFQAEGESVMSALSNAIQGCRERAKL